MGSAQSYITPEAAVTALVVAGAVGLGYTQLSPSTSTSGTGGTAGTAAGGPAKKGKKKAKQAGKGVAGAGTGESSEAALSGSASKPKPKTTAPLASGTPRVVPFPDVIPGQFDAAPISDAPEPTTQEFKAKKSKKKKGKAPLSASEPVAQPGVKGMTVSVDYASESSVQPAAKQGKGTKRPLQVTPPQPPPKQEEAPPVSASSASSSKLTRPLQQSTTSIDTDGSWTRVGAPRRGASARTDTTHAKADHDDVDADSAPTTSEHGADATPSGTGESSPVRERAEAPEAFLLSASREDGNRLTLAEKLLPKPRKTGVDDMLQTPDYPSLARVMRVQPRPDEQPAQGFSWGDYEDVRVATDGGDDADGEDDGWGVVASKRSKRTTTGSSFTSPATSQTLPQKASETLTKRQRQNASKREAEKAARAAAEGQRLAALAQHKRGVEGARMAEQTKGGGGGKVQSGGMKAVVDERGKLVWE